MHISINGRIFKAGNLVRVHNGNVLGANGVRRPVRILRSNNFSPYAARALVRSPAFDPHTNTTRPSIFHVLLENENVTVENALRVTSVSRRIYAAELKYSDFPRLIISRSFGRPKINLGGNNCSE